MSNVRRNVSGTSHASPFDPPRTLFAPRSVVAATTSAGTAAAPTSSAQPCRDCSVHCRTSLVGRAVARPKMRKVEPEREDAAPRRVHQSEDTGDEAGELPEPRDDIGFLPVGLLHG